MKNKFLYHQFEIILSDKKFKLIFLLIIFNSFSYSFVLKNSGLDFFSALLKTLLLPSFNMFLVCLIMMGIYLSMETFNDCKEYIIRLGDCKFKNRQMLKLCLMETVCIFLLQMTLLVFFTYFFHIGDFDLTVVINGTNILVYIIFFLIRAIILLCLINYTIVYLCNFINKYFIFIFFIIMFAIQLSGLTFNIFRIESLSLSLIISDYFTVIPHTSMFLEVIGSVIFIVSYFIINETLVDVLEGRKKDD